MPHELVVPAVGESITEVQIGRWLKSEGDQIARDEPLVEIESDKATLEVSAPVDGTLGKVLLSEGQKASVGDIIGYVEAGSAPEKPKAAPVAEEAPTPDPPAANETAPLPPKQTKAAASAQTEPKVMPAARRALAEKKLEPGDVEPTGPGGRLLKEDVLAVSASEAAPSKPASTAPPPPADGELDQRVPMSPMRQSIAARLVQAQQTAALLTTFNEVDMSGVMELRKQYQESFQKRYGVKLGFMSFFVKAVIEGLKEIPAINAVIDGEDIVYRRYYDIGLAVASGKGLVVPVLRRAELMSFAEIELAISDFGARAKENKIQLEELKGGTFTISNGGVFGSMLSTPIVNPPQSGILGLHAIQERPVVVDSQIVIRPMMYLALTYDHRLVDGREAVTFLKRIKEVIETPSRMLLEV